MPNLALTETKRVIVYSQHSFKQKSDKSKTITVALLHKKQIFPILFLKAGRYEF
jgi:hypothetical protein